MNEIQKLPYARKQMILDEINKNKFVNTLKLAQDLDVSYMTIYRDINELVEAGEVIRVHGGAKAVPENSEKANDEAISTVIKAYGDLFIEERFKKEIDAKREIAKKAVEFVNDGDVIAMDPSTTTLHMCPYLMEKDIIVVTTSLSVALQFSSSHRVKVLMCGGIVRNKSLNVVGDFLSNTLEQVIIDKCFVSAHSFDYENGLTDITMEESDAKKQLIKRSSQVFILLDETKISTHSSFVVCKVKDTSVIITDERTKLNPSKKHEMDLCAKAGSRIIYGEYL